MGDEVTKFGAWRAMVSDPGFDGGAPTISAMVGGRELSLVLSHGDKCVSAIMFGDIDDELIEQSVHVAPWSRTAVLCVLEAVAAVAIAQVEALPCPVCECVSAGNTCCPNGPAMAELAAALDRLALARDWWGEQIPASPYPDCMSRKDYARWVRNNRGVTSLPGDDLVVVKAGR